MEQRQLVKIVTVALPQDAVDAVARIAKRTHKSKTQVLREAISLKDLVERELGLGARFLIERGDTIREIVYK